MMWVVNRIFVCPFQNPIDRISLPCHYGPLTIFTQHFLIQYYHYKTCYLFGVITVVLCPYSECNIIPNKNMCTKVRLKGDSYKGENIKANLAAMVSRSSLSCGSSGPFIDHCSSLMFMSFNIRSPSSSQ